MNEVLLFFILKYKGNWLKIYKALEEKEIIGLNQLIEVESKINTHFISIIDGGYPKLLKQIYMPPFGLFTLGNKTNLYCQKVTLIGDISFEAIKPIIKKVPDITFILIYNNENFALIKKIIDSGSRIIIFSRDGMIGILATLNNLLKSKNVLIVCESYLKNKSLQKYQPLERISMGLSYKVIIKYSPDNDQINLALEISKLESISIFNIGKCPKNIMNKYDIKSTGQCELYHEVKN